MIHSYDAHIWYTYVSVLGDIQYFRCHDLILICECQMLYTSCLSHMLYTYMIHIYESHILYTYMIFLYDTPI